ncbi:MAG: hypothetical protein J5605_06600, partial [Bacteroidales bacterium]|nr:hypothetical protein [Bacteroidales bacterium]
KRRRLASAENQGKIIQVSHLRKQVFFCRLRREIQQIKTNQTNIFDRFEKICVIFATQWHPKILNYRTTCES